MLHDHHLKKLILIPDTSVDVHSMHVDYNGGFYKLPKFSSNPFAEFNDVEVDVDDVDWIAKEGACEREIDKNANQVTLCCYS